jgi:hypothetical protein
MQMQVPISDAGRCSSRQACRATHLQGSQQLQRGAAGWLRRIQRLMQLLLRAVAQSVQQHLAALLVGCCIRCGKLVCALGDGSSRHGCCLWGNGAARAAC